MLLVLALLTAHRLPGKPFSCRIEHNTLIVLDSQGRECWRKAFPYALMEGNSPELASLYTWIGDLDGDGRNEVLFAPHPLTAGAGEYAAVLLRLSWGGTLAVRQSTARPHQSRGIRAGLRPCTFPGDVARQRPVERRPRRHHA